MASRENQTIQVALIIFVILTVGLIVGTYYFYSQAESKRKEVARLTTENQNLTSQRDLLISKYEHLKFFIGAGELTKEQLEVYATDEELNKLKAQFEADMAMYGEGLAPENRNYRTIPENLIGAIRTKNTLVFDTNGRNKTLLQERDSTVTTEKQRTQQAIAGQQKAAADLASERGKFTTERSRFKSQTAESATRIASLSKELTTTKDTAKTQEDTLKKELVKWESLASGLTEKLKGLKSESFEVPDGKVIWVNQNSGFVWINVGSEDGLRTQTTFSVYDHNANGVTNPKERKARIEVTRLISAHVAEARVLEDKVANPILPGDKIHTPAWQPGRKLKFAIAGTLDVDGDGKSDLGLIRRIISMNGGEVDLELQKTGDVKGQLTVNTRYLVLGSAPLSASGEVDEKLMPTYTEIIANAQQLGVEKISLDQFLNLMGWRSGSNTVPLGRYLGGAVPKTIKKDEPAKKPKEGFQERKPPARGADGAF